MSGIKDLGKGDMSGILHLGGFAVLGIGFLGASLHLVTEAANNDLVVFLTTATFAIGIAMLMFAMGSVHAAMIRLGAELEVIKQLAAQAGSGENREQFERRDADQILRSVTSYIEMEMWSEAYLKGAELVAKYPKSDEAKKLRPNLDHLKLKAQQKPAAAPAARPATGAQPKPVVAAPQAK